MTNEDQGASASTPEISSVTDQYANTVPTTEVSPNAKEVPHEDTTRSNISAIYDALESGKKSDDLIAAARARDEKGRFAMKAKEDAAPKTDNKVSLPSSESLPDKQAVSTALEPPAMWKADAKEAFLKLPPELQKVVVDKERSADADYTRKTQELAKNRARYAEIDQAIEPYRDNLTKMGIDAPQVFKQFLAVDDFARRDPVGYARWVLEQNGKTPQDLLVQEQQQRGQVNPEIEALKREIQDLRGWREQTEQQSTAQQQSHIENEVQSWAKETGTDGKPVRPFFEQVQGELLPIVSWLRQQKPDASNTAILQEAYDRAVYANPQTRDALLNQKKLESSLAARRAGSSVVGSAAASASSQSVPRTTRERIERAWDEASR